MRNPESWLQAAHNKWAYPVGRDYMIAAETYDLIAQVNSRRKPKPIPRPWPDANKKTIGSTTRSREEIVERLSRNNKKE